MSKEGLKSTHFAINDIYTQLSRQRAMSKIISIQLMVLGIVGLLCNTFTWILWGRKAFEHILIPSLHWYVIYPFFFQELVVLLIEGVRRILASFADKDAEKDYIFSAISGAFLYNAFFFVLIYFYRDISIFWLFAVCPLLLTSMYRDFKWVFSTLIFSMMDLILIICIPFTNPELRYLNPARTMMSLEVIVIAVLVSHFAIAMHNMTSFAVSKAMEAEATKQAKEDFFARMSHEIRTPINAVLGMDEMILREDVSPEVEAYAMNIRTAGQSLLSLVNDILDSSKLEVGKVEIVPVEYDLLLLLNDCLNMVSMRAESKGLKLNVKNDFSVPRSLFGDEVRIRQILINILTNAIKYTREGSVELDVRWKKTAGDTMNLILKVSDTGIGISEEAIPKLFNSFERLDEKKNKYIEGTGLGLSITKQLIDLMNGEIQVESEVGLGSTFTVIIPQTIRGTASLGDFYKGVHTVSKTEEKYKEKFIAPDATVLVVDDVQMNIDVFRGLLKKTQMRIDSALSGEETLRLVQKKKYDIIFMDHLMPEMDGVETLAKMKEMSHLNENTPVIALTANAGTGAEEEYKKYGFDDYMSKPVKGKNLEETVYKYLSDMQLIRAADAKAAAGENEDGGMPDTFLKKISFLDVKEAMTNFDGNEELLKSILESFRSDNMLYDLSKYFQERNWKEYVIRTHGLKSISRSIGAIDLSEKARLLEKAGKEENSAYIEENHAKMMAEYEKLLSRLSLVL